MWDVTLLIKDGLSEFQISTHTSRVGCDNRYMLCFVSVKISTHTSRVGCDSASWSSFSGLARFLLTHPVWDVTLLLASVLKSLIISTHTSRVGCDYNILLSF